MRKFTFLGLLSFLSCERSAHNYSQIPNLSTSSVSLEIPPPRLVQRTWELTREPPPESCFFQGITEVRNGENMVFHRLNCPEQCSNHFKLPSCSEQKYTMFADSNLDADHEEGSFRGILYVITREQPCSISGLDCCNSCSSYMGLIDHKNGESGCPIVLMDEKIPLIEEHLSTSSQGKCCVLENFRMDVIVTGTIDRTDRARLFTKVDSICQVRP